MKRLTPKHDINKLLMILLFFIGICTADNHDPNFENSSIGLNDRNKSAYEEETIRELMLDLPLSFIENRGQASQDVEYIIKTPQWAAFFKRSDVAFIISSGNNSSIVNMTFEGTGPQEIIAENPLSGKVNFLLGNDSSKWITELPTYAEIRYENLYPGIDLIFRGSDGILKHEFLVEPEADPNRIVLAYDGQSNLSLDDNGSLVIRTPTGDLTDSAPFCYQDINGRRAIVDGEYQRIDDKRMGFRIQNYSKSYPLVIDPVLKYSTYLGGSNGDSGYGISVDKSGNAYVTGITYSTNFPTQSPFQAANAGSGDAFVTKLNPCGSGLIYSTYLGGNSFDSGYSIDVDDSGNAYVAGITYSTNFPTQNPYQATYAGGGDTFVTKLNPCGSGMVYSTYLGGSGIDQAGFNIGIDAK
jgi:hypothetical protein